MSTKKLELVSAKKFYIENFSSFMEWEKSLHRFSLNNELKSYVFDLSELSFSENVNLTTQVDEFSNACGCKSGSAFMSLTLVSMVTYFFVSDMKFSELTVYQFLSYMGVVLLAALTGKGIGLLHAHWNLIKLARNVRERLTNTYALKQSGLNLTDY